MSEPRRIQRKRTKEWRMPLLHGDGRWPLDFKHNGRYYPHIKDVHELAGKTLACWCPEGLACHADLLLELANGERT